MKTTALLAIILLAHSAAQAATVYECTDSSGRKTYSQSGGKNCKADNLGKPSLYTSAPPAARETAPPEPVPEAAYGSGNSAEAEHELQAARQALEAGRKVRMGNERNYAKYLERIQGLENRVKAAQEKVNAAQSGSAEEGAFQ